MDRGICFSPSPFIRFERRIWLLPSQFSLLWHRVTLRDLDAASVTEFVMAKCRINLRIKDHGQGSDRIKLSMSRSPTYGGSEGASEVQVEGSVCTVYERRQFDGPSFIHFKLPSDVIRKRNLKIKYVPFRATYRTLLPCLFFLLTLQEGIEMGLFVTTKADVNISCRT